MGHTLNLRCDLSRVSIYSALIIGFLIANCLNVHAQATRGPVFTGSSAMDSFGAGISCGGEQIAIGAPDVDIMGQANKGEVKVFHVSSGALLATILPPSSASTSDRFGESVLWVRDVFGPSEMSLVIGAPQNQGGITAGRVSVFTDLSSGPVLEINGQTNDRLGLQLASFVDVTSDNIPEILISAPGRFRGGQMGNDGAVIVYDIGGQNPGPVGQAGGTVTGPGGELLGTAVTGISDLGTDGVPDIIAGAPGFDEGRGIVRVFSGTNQAEMFSIPGQVSGEKFGAKVARIGDINLDGREDFMVSSPEFGGPAQNAGRVVVVSGADADSANFAICELEGTGADEFFGQSLAGLGDIDGDSMLDFAIGAPGAFGGQGAVHIYNFSAGACQHQVTLVGESTSDIEFGHELSGMDAFGSSCNFNGDTLSDFLVTSFGQEGVLEGKVTTWLGVQVENPTPTPTPPPIPEAADISFRLTNNGELNINLTLDRDPPAGGCQARLLGRVKVGDSPPSSVFKAVDLTLQTRTTLLRVLDLPKSAKVGDEIPVLNLMVKVDCPGRRFNSNVFARFLNCGPGDGVTPMQWVDNLKAAFRTVSPTARRSSKRTIIRYRFR